LKLIYAATDPIVFYQTADKDPGAWIQYCRKDGVHLYLGFRVGSELPVAWIIIDNFRDRCANIGYSWLPKGFDSFREAIDGGKRLFETLLGMKDESGRYSFSCLLGHCPAFNKKSTLYALKCGGKLIGTLPHGAWVADKQKSEPCHIISFERSQP
jgi:hypothetical protein